MMIFQIIIRKKNLEIVFKYLKKNCILHNKLNFMSRNSNAELGNLIEDSCLLPEAIASYKRYENIFNEQSKLDMMATLQLHRDWSLLGVQAGLWTIDPLRSRKMKMVKSFYWVIYCLIMQCSIQ